MTEEKLFSVLKGSYHDGSLLEAKYINGNLFMYCHRNPPLHNIETNDIVEYVVIKFENVTDLEVYDWRRKEDYVPYNEKSFHKPKKYWCLSDIYQLTCNDGLIEFAESVRFRADEVKLLAHSEEELKDYLKYFNS